MKASEPMIHDPDFWALGPRPAPADIATELARAMEVGRFVRRDTTYVQTVYTVALSPADLKRFDGRKRELVATLKDTLVWWAGERHYTAPGDLRVRLIADEELEPGQLTVEAGLRRDEAAKLGRIRG